MTRRKCIDILCVALPMVFVLSKAVASQPLFLAQNKVPEGFETLSEPQQSLVDIYYGNRYLTSQLATFQPGKISLSNVDEVVRLIGSVNDPSFLNTALSGELNTHAESICPPNVSNDCGVLNPPVAGVIFDESKFRVDIFVNPRFLLTRAADVRKYLPPSDAGFAMMQNFSAAATGSSEDNAENDYTLNGLTLLSYYENSVLWSWDYSKSQHFSVNQLFGQREYEGFEYNLGLLSSQGFGLNFTSDQPLVGARFQSSDNTRNDTDFSGGMPVEIFMPLRGRVEIRRDGRLIASYFHEAGLQALDTTTFPSGAYDIEIRILDEQGNLQSQESRFFAKQYQLPPEGEWQFFAETGRVMTSVFDGALPQSTEQWLSRAGVSRRIFDTMAGTLSAAATLDTSLLELGIYNLGYRYELSPSVMVSDNGSYGMTLTGRTWLGDVSLNGSYRRLWRDDTEVENADRPSLIGDAFEQSSFSVSAPLWRGSANYRFSSNRNNNDGRTETHGVSYTANVFRTLDYDTNVTFSFSESEGNSVALLSFEWRFRQDRWNFRVNPRAEVQNNNGNKDKTEKMRLSASWDDGDLYDGQLTSSVSAEIGSGERRLDGAVQYGNRFGRAALNVNHSSTDANQVTNYNGSFSTSFLTDGNVVAMGGEQRAESALVVNLDGRTGDVFDVKIDGQRRGYAVAGRPSVIPLTPFEEYTVTLSPSGDTLYSFDERERRFTLYPGNVMTLDYEAIPLQLLFGRLLVNGEPLDRARITGGLYPSSTDDIGMFQIEARSDINELRIELENGWQCSVPVEADEEKYILRMGTLDLAESDCVPELEGQLAIGKRDDS
ncbi:TcfC E-set like domain-containing protein [Endozoicomonas arenosclerae]|uniref:TcfC E-set like domain-containing protein n=1 Tax=Endozoicomonas arenosclerae TaxID=1633495 RepID=UPI0009A1778C|nr:TcfC E-set like domain-containing protein [Endozoicomonas arenosclerae]